MTIWTHGYSFYTLSYNLTLFHLSCCFGHWDLFQLGPVSLWHIPSIKEFFSFSCLLVSMLCGSTKCSRLISYISSLVLQSFFQKPRFLSLGVVLVTKMWALDIFIFCCILSSFSATIFEKTIFFPFNWLWNFVKIQFAKRKEILIHATAWMNLEDIMLM